MVRVSRRLAAVVLLMVAGCGGGAASSVQTSPPATERPDATPGASMSDIPADTLLMVRLPDRGHAYRLTQDGRYFVSVSGGPEREEPLVSRSHPGVERLPDGALHRIRGAIDDVGFFDLPRELDPNLPDDPGSVVLPSGEPLEPEPVHVAAGDGTRVALVTIRGSLLAPGTLGPLEPLYRILDEEAIGGWMNE